MAIGAPWETAAVAPVVLAGGPGNQTAPTLTASHLAYLDDWDPIAAAVVAPDLKVLSRSTGVVTTLTTGGGVDGYPDAAGSLVAWRRAGLLHVHNAATSAPFFTAPAPGDGGIALGSYVVAWELGAAGGSDIAWRRTTASAPVVLIERPGAQRAVAASVDWVAFADDAEGGSVHLLDTRNGTETVVFPGTTAAVRDVAVFASAIGASPVVAVAVDGAAGTEIVVLDPARAEPVRLVQPGAKANLQLHGEWVGFEDLSTGEPKVVLWNWTSGRLFVPAPTGGAQVLHDLVALETSLQAVWADDVGGDFDVVFFETPLPLPDVPPPPPPGGGVICADADATVLADFSVTAAGRVKAFDPDHDDDDGDHDDDDGDHDDDDGDHDDDDGDHDDRHTTDGHEHDDRWHALAPWRGVGGALFPVDRPTRVLVCIEASAVASAWVGVGSEVVAAPADFQGAATIAHEARLTVAAGEGRAGAVIVGANGSSLRVRVLADPQGDEDAPPDGTTCIAEGNCPTPRRVGFGCVSAGDGAGLLAVLAASAAALRPIRRRRVR